MNKDNKRRRRIETDVTIELFFCSRRELQKQSKQQKLFAFMGFSVFQ